MLVLKNGHLIDPRNGIDRPTDIGIENGRVAAVQEGLGGGERTLDLAGLVVTPGLVDMHTHLFVTLPNPDAWAGEASVHPDAFSFRSGTTTMVDAGSAGWRNFGLFRATLIEKVRTRVFAMVNIAGFGMISDMIEQDPRDFRPEEMEAVAARHRDVVVGVKSAHYQRPDWLAVERGVEAAERSGLPFMVDFGHFLKERPYWELVGSRLRPGDISTHCYRGSVPVAGRDGKVHGYLRRARERGVLFDVGHGMGSFVLRNAVAAVREGFYPDTISTDLHTGSMNGALMDMPTLMSKFLAMGMSLPDVVARVTAAPARVIGHPELGHLSVGAPADVAAFRLMEGQFGFGDVAGGRIAARRRLLCELTLKDGEVVWDWNARSAADYRSLGGQTGVEEWETLLEPPAEEAR